VAQAREGRHEVPPQIAWSEYLSAFNAEPPADEASLTEFERASGFKLPAGYTAFLRFADGGEGIIGRKGAYAIFWRIEDVLELNDAYEVARYAPSLILFGSNGGGDAFAFDRGSTEGRVVQVPFVGLDLRDAIEIGPFVDLLQYLAR
jgi:hypothetical protein